MKLYKIFWCFLFLFVPISLVAQDYSSGIGLRLGLYSGLTYSKKMGDVKQLEIIAGTRRSGFRGTALLKWVKPLGDIDGMHWCYGIGGHIGFFNFESAGAIINNTNIGADGVLGIEYYIPNSRFSVGADYKLGFDLVSKFSRHAWLDEPGINVKFWF
jgi:hypothetical protein